MRYFVPVGLCFFPGTTTGGRARFWRIGGALLVVLLLAVLFATPADAEPRIKVGGCEVYATNYVDPIAFTDHLHHHFGNTSTTNQSTVQSLFNAGLGATSCKEDWFTSAAWFPVEQNEPVNRIAVYYRAPGDQAEVRSIPEGLQLVAVDQQYNCNQGPFQDTPPYGCAGEWSTRIIFPDCWDTKSLEEEHTVSSNARGECPSTHPYRIPKINYLIGHENPDGVVPNPLQVSAGINEWHDWTSMHADYFAANQPVFNSELLDLCLRNAPDSVTVADPRCGEGP
jgi:hypothetical protein